MALVRYTPADLFQQRFNRFFEDFVRDAREGENADDMARVDWRPAVDIRETEDSIVLLMDVPGVTKEQLDLTVEEDSLSIRAQRDIPEEERDSYRRVERRYGTFGRTFSLPPNVDRAKVAASFQDGVLSVSLPKAEAAKPRKIEIK